MMIFVPSNYHLLLPCSLFLQLSSSGSFHLFHYSLDTIFLSTFSNSDVSVPSNLFINSYQLCYHLKLQSSTALVLVSSNFFISALSFMPLLYGHNIFINIFK